MSGRSDGGFLKWVGGWVCVRVLDGIEFEKESGWVHMMEICLHGNWVCARDGPCRLARKCFETDLTLAMW